MSDCDVCGNTIEGDEGSDRSRCPYCGSPIGRRPREIARGPDGKVYFFLKDSLVRADPNTFNVEALCPAAPGRMVFIGNDLYLGGTGELRRLKEIAGR